MLKLNASYSKKVRGETQFSSQGYHASIEIELPDGLTPEQLQARIHQTFALVRDSVESEIGGTQQEAPAQQPAAGNNGNGNGNGHAQPNGNGRKSEPASAKQVKYLIDLAAQKGLNLGEQLRKYGAATAYDLSREQCSKLIDEITRK